ncbi:DUF2789 domain-containing protein [Gammaproteobacteria bacterium AS21]
MESPIHTIVSLFNQLGLDDTAEGIDNFIEINSPLPSTVMLHEADIWNTSQAAFLKQAVEEDADWAEIVNQLDTMLR